ncbi:MAG TPA: VCBS repeat-containing protein [Candidatus Binatia bacterium]|nr:VCBS repeat-containing protein [Candidatus Binatia bacterium]
MRRLLAFLAALQFACLAWPAFAQFNPPKLYTVGANPNSVAVADVNGDGKLDLVTVNATLGNPNIFNFSVLLGNGNGTFQPAITTNLPFDGANLVIADMNGDHIPDLVITAQSDTSIEGSIIVMLGEGNGKFAHPMSFYAGGYAYYLAVGDVNGDGIPDVVCTNVTNIGQPSIAVLLGNGNGTLQPPVFYMPPGPDWIILADLNHDGHLDIAATDSFTINGFSQMDILLNNGDGTFAPYVQYDSDAPGPLAAGDVNNDGNIDLVTADGFGDEISTDLGNGNGTFQPSTSATPIPSTFPAWCWWTLPATASST